LGCGWPDWPAWPPARVRGQGATTGGLAVPPRPGELEELSFFSLLLLPASGGQPPPALALTLAGRAGEGRNNTE